MMEVSGRLHIWSISPGVGPCTHLIRNFFAFIFVIYIIDGFHLWAGHVASACTGVQIYIFSETPLQLSFRSSEFEH